MNAHQKIHQIKLSEWSARFAEQKASGLTVKQWCDQAGVSKDNYYYWKRILKENALDQMLPDIVPLASPSSSCNPLIVSRTTDTSCTTLPTLPDRSQTIQLKTPDFSIEFDSDIPESFLQSLIKAVRHA
ncbi:MAG: hypothetical protein MJ092_08410 [Lachnospiraceae bacterium]|nr:hypothetical protein [Lachnospiraceae bacterium]